MAKFFIEKEEEPELENAVLLEGLPGIGNVARLAVDFIIENLSPKKYATLYSDCFPKSVFVRESSLVSLPKVELYYKKREGKRDLVLLIGDIQPQETKDSYALMLKILKLAKEAGVNENITLGGIGTKNPDPKKVHGAASNLKMIDKFKEYNVDFDGKRTVNLIVGAAGLLIGLGKREGIEGISLLSETSAKPGGIGVESSKSLLKILEKYLNIDLPLEELESKVSSKIEERKAKSNLRKLRKMLERYSEKEDLSYIG